MKRTILITLLSLLIISSISFALNQKVLFEEHLDNETILLMPDEFCIPDGWAMRFTVLGAYDEPIVYIFKDHEYIRADVETILFEFGNRYSGWFYMPYPKDEVDCIFINDVRFDIGE